MNQTIANIIKAYIECLDFVDKIAGLVQTVFLNITGENGVKVQKSFPVSCTTSVEDCKNGLYNDLTPDSKYKTVIYFEDGGVTFNKREGNFICYTSHLKLVCWINVGIDERCPDGEPCTQAADFIKQIICQLPTHPVNVSPFANFYPVIISEDIRSNSIFSKYTYNELQTQYLMYPYDYFALNIETTFCVCVTDCQPCT
jgi:hypothetical protein